MGNSPQVSNTDSSLVIPRNSLTRRLKLRVGRAETGPTPKARAARQ